MQTYVNKVRKLLNTVQGPTETTESFRKRLNNAFETVEMAAGNKFFTPDITVDISDSDEESEEDWISSDSEIDEIDDPEEYEKPKLRNKKRAEKRKKFLEEKAQKRDERELYKKKRREIREKM